jgi:two-component system, sensor histidine kinase LadS
MRRLWSDSIIPKKAIGLSMFITLLLSSLLISTAAIANGETKQLAVSGPMVLFSDMLTYKVNEQMDILPDSKRQWSLHDIQTPELQMKFQPANGESSYGYTSAAYWVRLNIRNESSSDKWEISLLNPLMDKIDIFFPGFELAKDRNNPTYNVKLPPGQISTIYMRFETAGSMIILLRLSEQSALYETTYTEFLMYGLYYGMILIIIVICTPSTDPLSIRRFSIISFIFSVIRFHSLYGMDLPGNFLESTHSL